MTDLRHLLDDAAGEPPPPLDLDRVHQRGRALRRAHMSIVLVVPILVIVVAIVLLASVDTDEGAVASFDVPKPDTAVGEHMPDDTPIWIVHDRGGVIHVLDAVEPDLGRHPTPGDPWASNWCPEGRYFESPWGSQFDADGAYMGGPARHGLTAREFEIDDETERIVVGDAADDPMGRSDRVGQPTVLRGCDGSDLVPHPEYPRVFGISVD